MRKVYCQIFIFAAMCLCFSPLSAQKAIRFEKGNWNEIVEKAQKAKKLIFVDFYTQWCGPCLNMSEEVFTVPTVYNFYNTNFINAKIDAEHGEGKELAAKYQVKVYPTYLFIDPTTGNALHKSSGRQEPDTFIFTGESALNPRLRSFYLEANYDKNKNDLSFLNDYAKFKSSIYDREGVAKVLKQLEKLDVKLDNSLVWELFVDNITGYDNSFIREVITNYDRYVKLYGKEDVDNKLAKETSYAPVDYLKGLPDFKGKNTNIVINEINTAQRDANYDEAIRLIDIALKDTTIDRNKFLNALRFTVRSNDGKKYPDLWIKKCGEYIRYIAYNYSDRKDPYIHYEYALYLESLLRQIPSANLYVPESILEKPKSGKSEYTMRPDNLKPHP